jgi:hypothetical protein
MFASRRMQNLHAQERHRVNHSRSSKSVVSAPIGQSAGVDGSRRPLRVSNHHVRCLHPGGCKICICWHVIRSTISGRTSWAVSAPIGESAGVDGSGRPLGVSNYNVRCLHPGGCTTIPVRTSCYDVCIRCNVIASTIPARTTWSCLLRSASRLDVGWIESTARVARSVSAITMYDGCHKICLRWHVIASTIPDRTSWLRSASRLDVGSIESTARVARSVSAITMYDVCIRTDAKSAFAATLSRQQFQAVRVWLCRLPSCRWLVSTARCQQSSWTMFASGRMQKLHPQDRNRVNPSRSNKLGCVGSHRVIG